MGIAIVRRRTLVAALLVCGATGAVAADPPYTNRLINSADPYLLLHAHNPVDWYPWGPEAFAKAKAENKPIFLSVGYSTCYWCHVAEKEIYSNPAIAALMNKWFVNVKVDREERPAVDRFYIVATEMLTGHGAWPNNLFLTPTGEPFYAGSYFPPRDDGGQPGFPTVLAAIHDLWDHHRADQIAPAAKSVMDALRALEAKQDTAPERPVTPRPWLKRAAAALLDSVDPRNGGFGKPGSGPKFPQAPALDLLAVDARLENNADAAAALARTLDAMAFGGIDDQLAGGFHRYATDPGWSVPHFEKMLSDNAQLLLRYAGRYARTKNPLYRTVALATARFIMDDLGVKGGGFATALDAETAGVEGATYLWTRAEIEDVLGAAETDRFFGAYALTPLPDRSGDGTGPSGLGAPGVLRVRLPIGETLARNHATDTGSLLASFAADRAKLLAVRERRPQPVRDDKVVSSLNGMAIAALARAGAVLARPDLVTAATGAADRIWTLAFDEASGTLHHQIFDDRAVLEGDLDDYAALGSGLISLAEATGDARWRARAATLADTILSRFLRKDGRLISGTTGADLLPIALQDGPDADAPSGTSSALALLLRLGAGPGGSRYAAAAATIAGRLAAQIDTSTTSWPSAVVAMAEHPPINATVTGAAAVPPVSPTPTPAVPATADHVHAAATRSGSTVTVVLRIDPGFHVNSDKPTFDYLVPTSVSFAGVLPSTVDYPPAQLFKPGFATQALAVYEGSTRIEARFAADASIPPRLAVVAQACDSETCLPPSTLTVPIAPAADGTAAATP